MAIIMQNWISIFRDKAKKQQWQKEMIQINQLITPEDLSQFDRSDTVLKAKRKMKNASSGVETKRPTLMEFALVRNYLIVCLCLDNASRTGAIANMTCGEFESAKNEGGTFMVNVFNHKTVTASGPKKDYVLFKYIV